MLKIANSLWIIPLLPLAGSAINGLLGKKWPNSRVSAVGVGSVALTLLAVTLALSWQPAEWVARRGEGIRSVVKLLKTVTVTVSSMPKGL